MTERDDRLQEHLEALDAGVPLDRVLASAEDEDAALLRLASAVRHVAHPAPARRRAPAIDMELSYGPARAGDNSKGAAVPVTPPAHARSQGLMSRLTAIGLAAALIVALIGAMVIIPRLTGGDDVAGVGEPTTGATVPPSGRISAALTLPHDGKPGWLETDTTYPPEHSAFSPDGSLLATAHKNGTAIIWDLATGERLHTFQGEVERAGEQGQALTHEISDVTFSPDGALLAAARPHTPGIDVWDVATGELVASLEGARGLHDVAFSPDGARLAGAVDSGQSPEPAGKTIIWSTATWEVERTLDDAAPDIAFSPDGATLATRSGVSLVTWTGGEAGPVKLWDVATGELRATVPVDGFVMQIALSPDGTTLAISALLNDADPATLLVDVATGETLFSLPAAGPNFDSLAFSPDRSLLVVGYQPNRLAAWNTLTGELFWELTGPLGSDWLRYPVFSPDGALLAVNSSDGRVLLWDVGTLGAAEQLVAEATAKVTESAPAGEPETYTNVEYGFSFDVPAGWTLEELRGAVKLRNEIEQLQLVIGYWRPGEGWGEVWTSMPAGDFEDVGEVPFLSASFTKSLLMYENEVKVVTYGGPRGTFETPVIDGLQIVARLDDVTPYAGRDAYDQVEVGEAAQAQAEAILASFRTNTETRITPPTDGLPADVADWDSYELLDTGVTVPVPPGWTVVERPVDDTVPFSASVAIWPQWDSGETQPPGQPEISVTVWPRPAGQALRGWLDTHSTAAPFGSDTGAEDEIYFFGVQDVEETTLGGQPALGFTHDVMGVQVRTIIAEGPGVVAGLSKTHADQFPLGPVFETMQKAMVLGTTR